MVVDLYMVRIVLNSLGAVDYGVFDVVAGVVLLFQSVSSVLVISTQRFYSFSLGENDSTKLQDVFSSSMNVFLVLSLIILVLCETLGIWGVNTMLDIPDNRMSAANWIFQFSIFSFLFTLLQIPYSAAVIAHEDMGIYSVITIANCLFKLAFAFLLTIAPIDRLIFYGAYLLLINIIVFLSYLVVGTRKYQECHYDHRNAHMHRDILKFSGWTLWGTTATVGITQLSTIIVNVFFGPITNAARAVSFQINSAINAFCASFLTAIRPPMIKAYAEGKYDFLNNLFEISNKCIFYSFLIVCIPLFLEMDTILYYWLKISDGQTVLFSRLIVVYAFILALNNPITFIIHAAGRVKEYHVLVEIPTLLCAPITYLLFWLKMPAYTSYVVMISAIIISHIIRIVLLKKYYALFDLKDYFLGFIIPGGVTLLLGMIVNIMIHSSIDSSILRFIYVFGANLSLVVLCLFSFGLKNKERKELKRLLGGLLQRNK